MNLFFFRRLFLFMAVLLTFTISFLSDAPVLAACNPNAAIQRVSVSTGGGQTNQGSDGRRAAISGDGRYITFRSSSTNMVSGDTNGKFDIFVHDRLTCTTTRVSVSSSGQQANGDSDISVLSGDGRYVAFDSNASNLVPDDTNGKEDVFLRDRQTHTTTRISVASDGTQGNDFSLYPAISDDGNIIAFNSYASNLVNNDTNHNIDTFVHNMQTGETIRVSVASDGSEAYSIIDPPAISADGKVVGFQSDAISLVPNDTNDYLDAFTHNLQTGETIRVSVASDGTQGNSQSRIAALSADGRYALLLSYAHNLIPNNPFVCPQSPIACEEDLLHDSLTGEIISVSVGTGGIVANTESGAGDLSADGRIVAFASAASNFVPKDTNGLRDIFIHDRFEFETTSVTIRSGHPVPNGFSAYMTLSNDGRYVAFVSEASNLVSGDTNHAQDVFVARVTIKPIPDDQTPPLNYFTTSDVSLTWNRVVGALGYQVQIAQDAKFAHIVDDQPDLTADELSITENGLDNDTYYWRIRAKQQNGGWGIWSTPEAFIVSAP